MRVRSVRLSGGVINTIAVSADNDEEREFITNILFPVLKQQLETFSSKKLPVYGEKPKTKKRKT